jgi:Recombinase zinc beta ribbon domain
VNGIDAKYLLSGLAECGRCKGTFEVRRRAHGLRRAFFYMCRTHRRRGPKICHGFDMPMPLADEAILCTFEKTVVDREILQRACARVVDDDDVHTVQAEAQKAELLKRQATLFQELQRLTDALPAGGESCAKPPNMRWILPLAA